jgi:WhiB family transcriptional regulator, redox-sensing transcriptional regulator
MGWQQQASCRGMDGEMWFPVGSDRAALLDAEQAKQVCRCCPVAAECLSEALDRNLRWGIWGGLDERERTTLIHSPGEVA